MTNLPITTKHWHKILEACVLRNIIVTEYRECSQSPFITSEFIRLMQVVSNKNKTTHLFTKAKTPYHITSDVEVHNLSVNPDNIYSTDDYYALFDYFIETLLGILPQFTSELVIGLDLSKDINWDRFDRYDHKHLVLLGAV